MLAMRDSIQLKHMFNSRPFFVMARVLHICFYSIDEGIPTSTDQSRFDSLQEQQTSGSTALHEQFAIRNTTCFVVQLRQEKRGQLASRRLTQGS